MPFYVLSVVVPLVLYFVTIAIVRGIKSFRAADERDMAQGAAADD